MGIGPERSSRRRNRGRCPRNRQRRLCEIQRHLLRISIRRCERTVEIRTADAIQKYGRNATWKDVAQRLLGNTCQRRAGRHEEDGCWPAFETP